VKVIALEGPSYAGKSTAIAHLRQQGIEDRAFVSNCYVDHIVHRRDIPPARTASAAAQLAAFETFMSIEGIRVRRALADSKPVVLLDRSVDTLLAHAHALDTLFGFDVHHQLRARLRELPFLRPDHTLYLDVPADVLSLRRKAAGHTAAESDYFLHEPGFLDQTRDYFVSETHQLVSREVTPPEVAHRVEALITSWKR
jgi:dTMP kinase